MEILRQGWFAEGVATYFGGPHYYKKVNFIKLWKANGLLFDTLHESNPHKMGKRIIHLKYTYYRFFIQFLIETYGIEKFQIYLKSYCNNPKDYKNIFIKVYNKNLSKILEGFSSYMTYTK